LLKYNFVNRKKRYVMTD